MRERARQGRGIHRTCLPAHPRESPWRQPKEELVYEVFDEYYVDPIPKY